MSKWIRVEDDLPVFGKPVFIKANGGHGQVPGAYIQYNNGKRIAGEEAIAEQARLLKLT